MPKGFLSIVILILIFNVYFCTAQFVLAQNNSYGLEPTREAAGLPETTQDIPNLIGKIIGIVLSFVGVIFLILMVYGGFTWMLARGKEQEVIKAKETIISAVYGIIIVLGAYAITHLIFNVLLGD